MSILSKVKGVVSFSATGFSSSVGSPNNFQDPDDLNLFADVVATMGNATGSGDSAAYVRLAYGTYPGIETSPAATRTTRKLKFRGTLIAQLDASTPVNAQVEAGFRYSLNNGGVWTDVIRYTNTTPNTAIGNGAPTDYEVNLLVGQSISQLLLEGFTNADSGLGGSAGNSYGRALAAHAYVEDYEEGVELLIIRPDSSTEIDNTGVPANYTSLDAGFSRDGIESSFHRFNLVCDTPAGYSGTFGADFISNFPAALVAQGVRHAQVIVVWDGDISVTDSQDGTLGEIVISWQANTAGGYQSSTGDSSYLLLNSVLNNQSYAVSRTTQRMIKDITASFLTSDQVKLRIRSQFLLVVDLDDLALWNFDVDHFESYLELRLDSRFVASFDWEPV